MPDLSLKHNAIEIIKALEDKNKMHFYIIFKERPFNSFPSRLVKLQPNSKRTPRAYQGYLNEYI